MNQNIKIIAISSITGAVVGSLIFASFNLFGEKSENELIKEFYDIENAVHISPHGLRGKMDKGDQSYILVDLRSQEEYEKEHIIGAVNIPAYKDKNTPAYEEKERIINSFKLLSGDKDVIVYCYSMPCMTGRKIGKLLADNGIYVKHLGIGWNEWRYFWNFWNHEHELKLTKPEEYIFSGKEPGIPKIRELPSPCGKGELSC